MSAFTKFIFTLFSTFLFSGCIAINNLKECVSAIPSRNSLSESGSNFIERILAVDREMREKMIEQEILKGNFPRFMRKPVRINVSVVSPNGERIKAYYYVLPDYLMIGSEYDFVRIPMQPKTAQKIADRFGFFLSTKKICDDVYKAAKIKLEPVPLTENRDSVPTFLAHNQLIEKQRKGRKGLIAGIKKDVIITSALNRDTRSNRVAIYGWHKLNGENIQPVYTGHVDWYVDYSHGIRLVSQYIYVRGKKMHYTNILKDSVLKALICDEDACDYYAYPYN